MVRQLVMVLLLVLFGVGGCSSSPQDVKQPVTKGESALVPVKERSFSISLPTGWKLTVRSESRDLYTFAPDDDPSIYVQVITLPVDGTKPEILLEQGAFQGRDAKPITSPKGMPGYRVEGATPDRPDLREMVFGYWSNKGFMVYAVATAPADKFDSQRALFEQILKSFDPNKTF